jgi:uncharacterized membrane protein (UPF0127 family)
MHRLRFLALICACLTVLCCVGAHTADPVNSRTVTLPDGFAVRAELKVTPSEMALGMMYRDSVADGEGMLFVHAQQGLNPYWMGHCKFPLDMIWMDSNHKVVEISANTPPCPSGGGECPNYGGHFPSQFVLEIGGGQAARHNVRPGSELRF